MKLRRYIELFYCLEFVPNPIRFKWRRGEYAASTFIADLTFFRRCWQRHVLIIGADDTIVYQGTNMIIWSLWLTIARLNDLTAIFFKALKMKLRWLENELPMRSCQIQTHVFMRWCKRVKYSYCLSQTLCARYIRYAVCHIAHADKMINGTAI